MRVGRSYSINTPCPKGVGWVMPVVDLRWPASVGIVFVGVFPQGGPCSYAVVWSASFLASVELPRLRVRPARRRHVGELARVRRRVLRDGRRATRLLVLQVGCPLGVLGPDRRLTRAHGGPDPRARAVDREFTPPVRRWARAAIVPPSARSVPRAGRAVETDLPSADMAARLERLAELHDRGLLDDQEYEIAKNAVLHDEDDQ